MWTHRQIIRSASTSLEFLECLLQVPKPTRFEVQPGACRPGPLNWLHRLRAWVKQGVFEVGSEEEEKIKDVYKELGLQE